MSLLIVQTAQQNVSVYSVITCYTTATKLQYNSGLQLVLLLSAFKCLINFRACMYMITCMRACVRAYDTALHPPCSSKIEHMNKTLHQTKLKYVTSLHIIIYLVSLGPEGEVLAKSRFDCCPRCGWAADKCEKIYERKNCDPNRCDWFNPFYFCTALGTSSVVCRSCAVLSVQNRYII